MSATAFSCGTHPACSTDRLRALSTLTTRERTRDVALAVRHFDIARRRGELVELSRAHAELLETLVASGDDTTAFEARLLQLAAEPSTASWSALCELLDTRDDDDPRWPRWTDLLEHALVHWGDGIRNLPESWRERLQRSPDAPHHQLRLVRSVTVGRNGVSFDHLRHRALSGCRQVLVHQVGAAAAHWLEALSQASCADQLDTLLLLRVYATRRGRRPRRAVSFPRLRDLGLLRSNETVAEEALATLLDSPGLERVVVLPSRSNATRLARVLARYAHALQRVGQLEIDRCLETLEAFTLLDGLGHIEPPDVLDLSGGRASASMLGAIPRLVSTRHARMLDLSRNHLDATALEAMLHGPPMPQLTDLDLSNNRLGDRALTLLATHIPTKLPALRRLDLRGNLLGATGLDTLLRSRAATRLESVHIGPDEVISDSLRRYGANLRRSRRLTARAARLGLASSLAPAPPRYRHG